MSKLSVFEEDKSLGNYEASNAFGVRATVEQMSTREISLAFPNEPPGVPQTIYSKQYSSFASKFTFSVQATPSEARESDKDIRCLVLLNPYPQYVIDYLDYMSPKIDFHLSISIKGTALVGRIEQLWVFNQHSGKIYTKFK
jgi:hypothetical protein